MEIIRFGRHSREGGNPVAFMGMRALSLCVGLLAPLLLSGLLYAAPVETAPAPALLAVKHLPNQSAEGLAEVKLPFIFDVVGDNRTGTDVYARLVKEIAADSPAFVVNTGDTYWHSGSAEEWDGFVDASAPLTMPYFIAPGNHEVRDKASEEAFKEFVRQPGNELYYSFRAGNALVIVLDTEEPGSAGHISGVQLRWLKKALAASRERFRFIFMHRPMYPPRDLGKHYEDSLNGQPEDRDALEALFKRYRVDAVFNGHEHLYLRQKKDGILHVITGGGGAPLHAPENRGGFYHYIRATVMEDSVCFSVIDAGGKLKDAFIITKRHTK